MKRAIHNVKLVLLMTVLFFISYFMFYDLATAAGVQLETGLPNVPGGQLPVGQELPSYINYLFIFGLGLIAVLALTQMMIGGLTYILAAGNVAKVDRAKDTIKQALIGLGLLLVSYLLLRTVNPDLVNLRTPNLAPTQFKALNTPAGSEKQNASGQWVKVPIGLTCKQVLGEGWLTDVLGGPSGLHCKQSSKPDLFYACCYYSPPPNK